MSLSNPAFFANGTIQPSRFVKIDTTAGKNFHVLQAGANEAVMGISQPGSFDAPGTSGAASDAARAGQPIHVYGVGDVCLLEIGASVTAGDYLESDANGKGVPAASTAATRRHIGAKALETGSGGEKIRVQVVLLQQQNP